MERRRSRSWRPSERSCACARMARLSCFISRCERTLRGAADRETDGGLEWQSRVYKQEQIAGESVTSARQEVIRTRSSFANMALTASLQRHRETTHTDTVRLPPSSLHHDIPMNVSGRMPSLKAWQLGVGGYTAKGGPQSIPS